MRCWMTFRCCWTLAALWVMGTLLPLDLLAAPALITEDVPGEFATYHPIPVSPLRQARSFTIAPDFSNVSNMGLFNFTDAQKQLLRANGFVAVPSPFLEMYEIYRDGSQQRIPAFVTVDAMLHTFHEQFDYILKWIEQNELAADLEALSDGLLAAALEDCSSASDSFALDSARRNAAFFAVAGRLIRETGNAEPLIPDEIQPLVDGELALIAATGGLAPSPLFDAQHDYGQFIPRGHYAGVPPLERYFRAMMWCGTMRFALEPNPDFGVSPAQARRMTFQALLVTRAMHNVELTSGSAQTIWNRIYQPTVFFVGKADGVTFTLLDAVARQVYGEQYAALTPDALAEADKLDQFVEAVQGLPPPAIASGFGRSFRFMGQRYIPDSHVLEVAAAGDSRMPRGLDVMAALGSPRAETILNETYHDPTPPSR